MKRHISAGQLGLMFYLSILTTGILTAPSAIYPIAGRDLWISSLYAVLPACVLVLIMSWLHRRYPGKSLIEYAPLLFGKWLGKLIGAVFLLFVLHITGIVIRQFSEFMLVGFFRETPLIVIGSAIVITAAAAVHAGVEVLGRFVLLATPIVLLLVLFILLPLVPSLEPKELLPIMERGPVPSLKGALVLQQWFLMYMLSNLYMPHVSNPQKLSKALLLSLGALMFSLLAGHAVTVMLLGETTAHYSFSFITLSRYVKVANFFEHLQSLVMAIWVIGLFVRLSMTYYVLAAGTSQLLNMRDYRPLVLPIGALMIVFSLWSMPAVADYVSALLPNTPYYMLFLAGLPLLVWLMALLRMPKSRSGSEP